MARHAVSCCVQGPQYVVTSESLMGDLTPEQAVDVLLIFSWYGTVSNGHH